ncbi:MAG: sulfatase-like hydrolase/transferase [Oscillospiraceae bacterium]|jgi:phosphoglycerol transferase MdoB-like AlkP superfamily enzyme|nr:sulfatase-like hydrolase/transferase [Oscillospiraceae bacterium]
MIRAVKEIRQKNRDRYKKFKTAFAVLFPLFLVLVTEAIHTNDLFAILRFAADKPKTIIFAFLVVMMIYAALALLTRNLTAAAAICAVLFFTFSVVEYFKFTSSGTHFSISDLLMSAKVSDVSTFALIRPTAGMIAGFLFLLTYVSVIFLLNIQVKVKRILSFTSALGIIGAFVSFVAVEPVYSFLYSAFDISTDDDNNVILSREKFTENKLIANLTESVSREIERILNTPESYSPEKIESFLSARKGFTTFVEHKSDELNPNVIIILSESFADLRLIDGIDVPDGIYDDFDFLTDSYFKGMSLVPTFGGGTVKTEFELLLGLPMKSVNNTPLPQNLFRIDGETEETFAKLYSDIGYSTTYIHPFKSTFYNRSRIYSEFGFDRLIFEEDLTADITYRGAFIDDATVFRQIESVLERRIIDFYSNAPSYIFATTMQNHMPYISEDFDGLELDFYFAGIRESSRALLEFHEYVVSLDYPTVVLFIGDHYPSFSADSGVYEAAEITAENCYEIYMQPYLIFSNFDLNYRILPDECVSSFYLPHLLTLVSGLPINEFTEAMLRKLAEVPIYTDAGLFLPQDEKLDMLAYDRIRGNRYSVWN